jgi:deazaflavin-dependent oxidoreductase (nitroreductase family)
MAWTFEMSTWRRVANWLIARALRLGLPLGNNYLLTAPGRKTRKTRTTPVTLVRRDGVRYLVAPYGQVEWVWNIRAAGKITLSRGRVREHITVTEFEPVEAAPILKQYFEKVPIVRPFFDASVDDSLTAFAAGTPRKAVCRLG